MREESEVRLDKEARARRIEIMEDWVRRIIGEVAQRLADGVVAEVGLIFKRAKETNYERSVYIEGRLRALEEALKERKPS